MTVLHGSHGATALVGITGLVVGVQVLVDDEWWLYCESTSDLVGCPGCGTRAVGHGRTRSAVRDLPIAGRPSVLVIAKRRWRCPDRDCEINTWTEQFDEVAPRASLTARARARLADLVNIEGVSVAAAAIEFGVGWHTANLAVAEHTDPVIADPARFDDVHAVGVDEKRFLNATVEHRTEFTTQVVDLDRHLVLDVIPGRSRSVLRAWFEERGVEWCAQITLATLDPAAGYRRALIDMLPNAVRVVDHFHVTKLANQAIDEVRRRTQQVTLGHRGHKTDPLFRIRRVLLTADERLTEERFAWMAARLAEGDPDGEVGAAWVAKELLRDVYQAVDLAHARRRLIVFFQYAAEIEVREVTRLARTIDRWSDEVLAYHQTGGASNGRVENVHMLAEKIRRTGHGFTNHDNYRRRLIGRLGIKWATVPTRRIRGRQTHSVA